MRLNGMHGRKMLYILVDSQSMHNFLSDQTVMRLGKPIKEVVRVHITVANG